MPLFPAAPNYASIQPGATTIGFGDSIIFGQGGTSGAPVLLSNEANSNSWFYYACMASQQRMRFLRNAGKNSDTTTLMLARIQTDVLAYRPNYCVIMGGTNDITAGVAQATMRSNLTAIITILKNANIMPIMCTIQPASLSITGGTVAQRHQQTSQLNAWIENYCTRNGIPLIDSWTALVDQNTGNFRTGTTFDGIHPNNVGYAALAAATVPIVNKVFPPNLPYLVTTPEDTINLIGNGLYLSQLATGIGPGWTVVAAGGQTSTTSLIQIPGILGYAQSIAYLAGSGTYALTYSPITTGWAVGDKVAFSAMMTAKSSPGNLYWSAYVTFTGGTVPRLAPAYYNNTDWSKPAMLYCEDTIPASTTSLVPTLLISAAIGNIAIGQMTLINLTSLGF